MGTFKRDMVSLSNHGNIILAMRSFIKLLFSIDRFLSKIEVVLISVALLAMLFFSAFNVILRTKAFNSGILWAPDLAQHLVLWVTILGASLATRESRHLCIDALGRILPKRVFALTQIFVSLFCIFICVLLTKYSYDYLIIEKKYQTMILLMDLEVWKALLIMPIGFGVITLRFINQLFEQLLNFSGINLKRLDSKERSVVDISVKVKI